MECGKLHTKGNKSIHLKSEFNNFNNLIYIMNEEIFNAIFWTAFITSAIGCIISLSKQAYNSKCKEVSCCCIKIIRDTEVELKEDELQLQNSRALRGDNRSLSADADETKEENKSNINNISNI